jgi:alkylmercury lyase
LPAGSIAIWTKCAQSCERTLFAWCAFDTLTYPVELHLSAQVTSRCPVTGSSIRLTVTPEQVLSLDPAEAQVSLVVDVAAGCRHNVREDVCNDGHFFASREAAFRWQAAHQEAVILSVEEAYQVGKPIEGSRFPEAEP